MGLLGVCWCFNGWRCFVGKFWFLDMFIGGGNWIVGRILFVIDNLN